MKSNKLSPKASEAKLTQPSFISYEQFQSADIQKELKVDKEIHNEIVTKRIIKRSPKGQKKKFAQ